MTKTAQVEDHADVVARMQDAIAGMEALQEEKLAEIAQLEKERDKAESDATERQSRIDELEDKVYELEADLLDNAHVRELAKARTAIYAGRSDEGRERLERVLDDVDTCWRTFA